MTTPDIETHLIDPSISRTVNPSPGETVTVSAEPGGGLTITELRVYRDEVGDKTETIVTHTGPTFATNSRYGDTVYQFFRV